MVHFTCAPDWEYEQNNNNWNIQHPLEKPGIIDSSGVKVYYTPTARQYDASTLQIGLDTTPTGQWIPGGLSYAHNAAFLPSDCTEDEDAFPEDGIKVFGSFLHQHTIGNAIMFRHIRDGVEQEPIDVNLAYELNICILTPISLCQNFWTYIQRRPSELITFENGPTLLGSPNT